MAAAGGLYMAANTFSNVMGGKEQLIPYVVGVASTPFFAHVGYGAQWWGPYVVRGMTSYIMSAAYDGTLQISLNLPPNATRGQIGAALSRELVLLGAESIGGAFEGIYEAVAGNVEHEMGAGGAENFGAHAEEN